MYTEGVSAQVAQTSLKDLIETAGRTFPNGNNECIGIIAQIDPAETGTVEIIGQNSVSGLGIVLSNDPDVGPSFIAYRCSKVEHTELKASGADVTTRVLVETSNG